MNTYMNTGIEITVYKGLTLLNDHLYLSDGPNSITGYSKEQIDQLKLDKRLPKGYELTDLDELKKMLTQHVNQDTWEYIRSRRNELLLEIDKISTNQFRLDELSKEEVKELKIYRKELLDITDKFESANDVEFPEVPEVIKLDRKSSNTSIF